jgi:protein O-GlcNAc transferase
MITTTTAQYEAKAIEFANNPEKFNYIREKLKSNKFAKVLFDTTRFTKNIETAYSQIYERYQDDLLPTNIYIE